MQNKVEDLIEMLGGVRAVAKELDTSTQCIYYWIAKRAIPVKKLPPIFDMLRKQGHKRYPVIDDLVSMSDNRVYKTLVRVYKNI